MDVERVWESQLANIEAATGRPRGDWFALVEARRAEGARHGQLVTWLKTQHGLSHGNANALVLQAARAAAPATAEELVDAQYADARSGLRPVYEAIKALVVGFGPDVEVAPKKTAVSLRRSRQFAVVTPASRTRVELGLNLGDAPAEGRLELAGGMCTHRVRLVSAGAVDDEVARWLRAAYDRA